MGKIVTFGEIMMRLAPPGFQRFIQARSFDVSYAGGEANVAVSLANYGEAAEFVTRLPKNELGQACRAFLRTYGVSTEHVAWGGDRLGIYFLETGAAQRASKVIYDRANSAIAAIQPGMVDWKAVFDGRGLVPLDGDHPGHIRRGGPGLRRSYPGRAPDGRDRLVRYELPRQAVEMGQDGG